MKQWTSRIGTGLFVLFCVAGMGAWALLPGRWSITIAERADTAGQRATQALPAEALLAEMAGLGEDLDLRLTEITGSMGPFLDQLGDRIASERKARERAERALASRLDQIQLELARLAAAPSGEAGTAQPTGQPDVPPAPAEGSAGAKTAVSFTELLQRARSREDASTRVHLILVEGGSKVGFDGTSNVHDFSGSTTLVKGEIEFDPERPEDAPLAQVRIRAATLDTGHDGRDEEMHETYLESAEHPEISFRLDSLSDRQDEQEGAFTALAHGIFSCHGVDREVTVPLRVEKVGRRGLRLTGEWKLLMSDHGISPPRALGGLIRTADEVTAWFHLQARAAR